MKITVHTILGLKQVLGQRQTDGAILDDLFAYMKARWGEKLNTHLFDPDDGTVLPHLRIMVNGQAIHFLLGMQTPLKEDDIVLILPLISGG